MTSSIDLSIVTSLYRSSASIAEFYRRASAAAQTLTANYEILFVNDGSPDNSLDMAVAIQQKDPKVVVIDLSRNFGHHKAMMTGLAQARGERVFILDDDLEEEPEWLLLFHDVLTRNACDVVYGVQEQRKGGFFERWSGDAFYRLFNFFSSTSIPVNAVNARLMTRRYVKALMEHREREIFLPGLWQLTGYRQVPFPITKHSKGRTTYSFARKITLFVNAITSFSDKPLVFIFYTGTFICLSAIAYIVWLLYLRWSYGIPLMGWPSLIVSIWLLGGLTIFFIGVLGIYMTRLYREIKQRPNTIIRDIFSTPSRVTASRRLMDLEYAGGHAGESFEDGHWWMKSRFHLLDRAMEKLAAQPGLRVLEIGCGTGVNLRYLQRRYASRLTALVGTDPWAQEMSHGLLSIQNDLPADESFDLILLMDVLEHVDQPSQLLASIHPRLHPGGWLLVTVPAFQWLWTSYDDMIHHKKRYSMAELRESLVQNGYNVPERFFLFSALFPFFVLQRLYIKCVPSRARPFKPINSCVNALLFGITWIEMRLWMTHNRWFGSSIVAFSQTGVPG